MAVSWAVRIVCSDSRCVREGAHRAARTRASGMAFAPWWTCRACRRPRPRVSCSPLFICNTKSQENAATLQHNETRVHPLPVRVSCVRGFLSSPASRVATSLRRSLTKGAFDFIGLNYYTANYADNLPPSNGLNVTYNTDARANLTGKYQS